MAEGQPAKDGSHPASRRVRNLYHMLLYIWGHHDRDELTQAPGTSRLEGDGNTLSDLFAHVLADAAARQLRRGLERDYEEIEEVGPRIRGRIQFGASVSRMLFHQGLARCAFDEFTADTPHNRILKTTLLRLLREGDLQPVLARRVRSLIPRMGDVAELELCARHFSEVRLHRNNREYGLMLSICRFIHEAAIPATGGQRGLRFRGISADWVNRKGTIFETFISRFYGLKAGHLCKVRTKDVEFKHQILPAEPDVGQAAYIPILKTDVLLDMNDGRRLIMECKFYGNPFDANANRFRAKQDEVAADAPKQAVPKLQRKLSNAHILQLGAYMDGLTSKEPGGKVEGMLLYVQPDGEPLDADFLRPGVGGVKQNFRVRCIDLTEPWNQIEANLLALLRIEN